MFEPDENPIATTDGRRPASAAGDRMMVALAAIALLGGALIAVGNVLPEADRPQTSEASVVGSPSPEPSVARTPGPTRSPRPLRSIQAEGEALPSPPAQFEEEVESTWIRVLAEIRIHFNPDAQAGEAGTLAKGAAAYATVGMAPATAGWMHLEEPVQGWIQAERDGRAVVRRFAYRSWDSGPSIDALIAGETGFAGLGWLGADGQYHQSVMRSADGARWELVETTNMAPGYGFQLAHGPAGWLLVGTVEAQSGSIPWLWQSADLHEWQSIGSLRDLYGGVAQLVGSAQGYVMTHGGYGNGSASLWFSADGVLWSERWRPDFGADYLQLVATPMGYYAWGLPVSGGQVGAAFSPDGWTWTEVDAPHHQTLVGVVAVGQRLVALEPSPTGTHVWMGTIRGTELTWEQDRSAAESFGEDGLTELVSDGTGAVVFGWERGTDAPLWWSGDGVSWQRHRLPASAFGGIPRTAAGGPGGVAVVGYRPSIAAANPVIWHLDEAGRWIPEATPVLAAVPEPRRRDCGEAPDDVLEVTTLDGRMMAYCFGDMPLVFRAWVAPCEGCWYASGGQYQPDWLAEATGNLLHLSPIEQEGLGGLEAVLPPSIERDLAWQSKWVEVTGHFADKAARSCRWEPDASEASWYTGTSEVVAACRSRFVVDRVRVVRGP